MEEAAREYNASRPGAGNLLLVAIRERGAAVARMPGIAPRDPDAPADLDVRRVLLRRHQYALIIVMQTAEIGLLIAVAHHKREPGYWHDRIGT